MTDNSPKQLEQFVSVAMQLVGHKIYVEYITVIAEFGPIEPEYFVEEWIVRNNFNLIPELESKAFKFFLSYLIEHSKYRG